jgi:hypothetical protein
MLLANRSRPHVVVTALAFVLLVGPMVRAADEPALSKAEMRQFLLTAKVVKSTQTKKGTTNPYRLSLTDGKLTHDASFQSIDERKAIRVFADGSGEVNFVDSYKYNVAGFVLAELLGLDDMVPMYVQRAWNGRTGAIGWWLPVRMDEADRQKQKLAPPDPEAWNRQLHRIRVFDALIYDNDINLTNVLIGANWKVYRVDFSRAFRLSRTVRDPKDLERCDRQLLAKLRALDARELAAKTKGLLAQRELQPLMARRDQILSIFEQLVRDKGEADVLYDYADPPGAASVAAQSN